MGLDMMAFKRRKKEIEVNISDEDPYGEEDWADNNEKDEEIFYWRKHPNLHGWMENLYYEKGGDADVFNCVEVDLTMEDLDNLEEDVENDNLPYTEGFFFGESSPEDKENDLEFIRKSREALEDGYEVYYTSWW
jgi:hypothetical protein